jgi:hypothetical protein
MRDQCAGARHFNDPIDSRVDRVEEFNSEILSLALVPAPASRYSVSASSSNQTFGFTGGGVQPRRVVERPPMEFRQTLR